MTRGERAEVLKALTTLQEYHRIEPLSEALQLIYLQAFEDYSARDVLIALRQSIDVHTWFPKVPELKALIHGSEEDRAALAWVDLLREIRRVGYTGRPELPLATMDTVERMWGSWVRLCETLPGDGPELLGWAKRFQETYRALVSRERMALQSMADPSLLTP